MNKYYDKSQLLGYNKLFSFVIGARGIGKTYQFKSWAISDYLTHRKTAWWVMRYKTEIDKITKDGRFFADVLEKYPSCEFKIDGPTGYLRRADSSVWDPFINFQALSESAIKAISDPECNKIIFDEFIPLPGIRYLNNEVERFLEFYFTISRGRDLRAFFLANNVTSVSPYFTYFRIKPGNLEFTQAPEIVIQNARTEAFSDSMRNTRFGQMIAGTHYSKYAIENESFADTSAFISEKLPQRSREIFNLKSQYGIFQIFICKPSMLYIRKRTAPANGAVIYAGFDEHDEQTIELSSQAKMIRDLLSRYYALGLLQFDSINTKSEFLQSFEKFLVRIKI